eukprot:1692289-Prymnesium_polylepis.1
MRAVGVCAVGVRTVGVCAVGVCAGGADVLEALASFSISRYSAVFAASERGRSVRTRRRG